MSEAFACFNCQGHGKIILGEGGPNARFVECYRCKGSGGLHLRAAGPGIPKSDDDDPYVPVPKGVNW